MLGKKVQGNLKKSEFFFKGVRVFFLEKCFNPAVFSATPKKYVLRKS